jgi:uroporphyrinogen-III decarboxylase
LLLERTEPIAHEAARGFSDHGHFIVDLGHGVLTVTKTISIKMAFLARQEVNWQA